jgi:hypothetical protein
VWTKIRRLPGEQPGSDLITQGQQGLAGVEGFERHPSVLLALGDERQQFIVELAETTTAGVVQLVTKRAGQCSYRLRHTMILGTASAPCTACAPASASTSPAR